MNRHTPRKRRISVCAAVASMRVYGEYSGAHLSEVRLQCVPTLGLTHKTPITGASPLLPSMGRLQRYSTIPYPTPIVPALPTYPCLPCPPVATPCASFCISRQRLCALQYRCTTAGHGASPREPQGCQRQPTNASCGSGLIGSVGGEDASRR